MFSAADRVGPEPADPEQLRALLARARAHPRHRLGQNFLIDAQLRDRLVAASGVGGDDVVLEVGAGLGALTVGIARTGASVVAVELDEKLVRVLRQVVSGFPKVTVVARDILDFDVAAAFPSGGHMVAGNVPYYLSGALLRRLLEERPRPRRLALVVQREVAERWVGAGAWSLATLVVHALGTPRMELELPPRAFQPAPQVSSALVVIDVRRTPAVAPDRLTPLFRLAERVFQFRRKQLQPALARAVGMPAVDVGQRLRRAGIDPSARAETLSLDDWVRLQSELD